MLNTFFYYTLQKCCIVSVQTHNFFVMRLWQQFGSNSKTKVPDTITRSIKTGSAPILINFVDTMSASMSLKTLSISKSKEK